MRKIASSISQTVELLKDGDDYTLKASSTFRNISITFRLGEEFDEKTMDGRNVKSIFTFDGNTLIHVQKGDKGHTVYRAFTDKELTMVHIF